MAPHPVITRVQPKRRAAHVIVHLDDGEPLELTLEAIERLRLGVGDSLSPQLRHHLLNADQDVRVRDAALNLISYRARTRSELRTRLRQKGFQPARITICLDKLEGVGLIDDASVAAAFIRDRLRHRPRGRAALFAELRKKGVASDLVGETIDQVFSDQDTSDEDLARTVAQGWVDRQGAPMLEALLRGRPDPEYTRAYRRLTGYMQRRGFRGATLRSGSAYAIEAARERLDD
ncbi:MAG: RecX family transcriptional regulator [Gemmatimonadota bacterium]